jgi:hypothetical protein
MPKGQYAYACACQVRYYHRALEYAGAHHRCRSCKSTLRYRPPE